MRIVPQTILDLKWSFLPPSQGQKQILTSILFIPCYNNQNCVCLTGAPNYYQVSGFVFKVQLISCSLVFAGFRCPLSSAKFAIAKVCIILNYESYGFLLQSLLTIDVYRLWLTYRYSDISLASCNLINISGFFCSRLLSFFSGNRTF